MTNEVTNTDDDLGIEIRYDHLYKSILQIKLIKH